ncbi:hypothetical protein CFN79_19120 [Chromobacterium vaccinii]|uniref:DUF4224 domain-containing protein n=1 Tax=Chromobacterium vaccinii TaxID=1108595 RepID=UPI000CE98ED2|nr:DUF4224 domain-containing protein [Chromobacterium vaccinii]AVG17810.1 hypothetical protein CFN79_19120 [Chromobacterium vaccinii]
MAINAYPLFLSREEVAELTGRKFKNLQIDNLRRMGISFQINASGWPIVVRSAIEPIKTSKENPSDRIKKWEPSVLSKAS